jgi:ADP-ribosyl-[dinitrogen reductase] hydrolase
MFRSSQLDTRRAFPTPRPSESLRDRYRGCLVAGAIGDALGRPVEGRSAERVATTYPDGLRDFQPWHGWKSGPLGTFTDDTQMTILVAEHLVEAKDAALGDLVQRIIDWGRHGRGIGSATREALRHYDRGTIPAGVESAGNGTTMRCAPYALAYAGMGARQAQQVADGSRLTHDDVTAAAAAVLQSAAVNLCLATTPDALDPNEFLTDLVGIFDGVDLPRLPLRHRSGRFGLTDLVAEVAEYVDRPASVAFGHFHNGAFVLETLPSVLACFLIHRDDPEAALVAAVMGGRDADTVAAMVGNLAGALHGHRAMPERWTGDLEDHDRLVELADALYDKRFGAPGGVSR